MGKTTDNPKVASLTRGTIALLALCTAHCGAGRDESHSAGIEATREGAIAIAPGYFRVMGNQLVDSEGMAFHARGVAMFPYLFDQYGWHCQVWSRRVFELDQAQAVGVNYIRVGVAGYANQLTSADPQLARVMCDGLTAQQMLDEIIRLANDRGMVVNLQVTGDGRRSPDTNVQLLPFLATRYRSNPKVWMIPENEPQYGLQEWSVKMAQYVTLIRNTGFRSPIVLDGIQWTSDLRLILGALPHDGNLVLEAHRYANAQPWSSTERANCDAQFAKLAKVRPVLMGEVGYDNVGACGAQASCVNQNWTENFLDYLADWTINGFGIGSSGFFWTSDVLEANRMRDVNAGAWFTWGATYRDRYLNRVKDYVVDPRVWQLEGAGSFDGSGRAQIVTRGGDGSFQIQRTNGMDVLGGCTARDYYGVGQPVLRLPLDRWEVAGIGTFETSTNGKQQILMRHRTSHYLQLLRFDLSQNRCYFVGGQTVVNHFNGQTVHFDPALWEFAAVGNFDVGSPGDELLLRHKPTGTLYIEWMKGNQWYGGLKVQSGGQALVLSGDQWAIAGGGQIDARQSSEEVVVRGAGGKVRILALSGSYAGATATMNWAADVFYPNAVGYFLRQDRWTVAGVGDFTGEGDGLLLQDAETSQMVLVRLDAATWANSRRFTNRFQP